MKSKFKENAIHFRRVISFPDNSRPSTGVPVSEEADSSTQKHTFRKFLNNIFGGKKK